MFGCLRYVFALAVLAGHLYAGSGTIQGPAPYAVWGFYCLSGYLMSLVLATKYPLTRTGLRDFAISRGLRLLPAYYAVAAFSTAIFLALPDAADHFISGLGKLPTGAQWANVAFPVVAWDVTIPDPVPQFWAVRVEFFFYATMALVLSRSRPLVLAWLAASLAYSGFLVFTGAGFEVMYNSVGAASLPFATGAFLQQFQDRIGLPKVSDPVLALGSALSILGLHLAVISLFPGEVLRLGLYSSLAASALAIAILRSADASRAPAWLARLDELGIKLAYGLYLAHWPAAVLVSCWLARGRNSKIQFATSVVLVHLFAYGLYLWIESPADRLRKRLTRGPDSPGAN